MARVIHSINITVSGSCHHADAVADEEHHRYALDVLRSASAVLLGRNTFDLFSSFWPEAVSRLDLPSYMNSFAADLESKPKYVLSSRSAVTEWKNTTFLRGPDLGEVTRFLNGTSGIVVVFGSPGLGTSLAAAGLIQEIHVLAQPFIGAAAVRVFASLNSRKNLALLEARPFQSGVVLLRYGVEA
ncbi:MAG: dihydrofolate reductase family protein [Pyrinomonadaceae bacterium]|nr:dihydrofolate reductase family protein [Pyrinomonadaceae bacterium]